VMTDDPVVRPDDGHQEAESTEDLPPDAETAPQPAAPQDVTDQLSVPPLPELGGDALGPAIL